MAQLFGKSWTRRELEAFANLDQIAGFTRATLQDGFERDTEIIAVRNGSGLEFTVCPSRGLDITSASFCGHNLTWRGDHGAVHPAFYSEENFGWLRGFTGGLVTTCGLNSFGPPCQDDGEKYGIHDRISYVPARDVASQTIWHDQTRCELRISGTLRQTRLFGANLRLERTISTFLGENRVLLRDVLHNDGFETAPAVVLYHCNFGFPLLDEGAQLLLKGKITPRDDDAAVGLKNWNCVEQPRIGFKEQVFFHDLERDEAGNCAVALWNPTLKLGVEMRFLGAQLPFFTQWKMLGAGAYVLGLEPSNAPLASRTQLKERGELPCLEAGESRTFEIEFGFVEQRS